MKKAYIKRIYVLMTFVLIISMVVGCGKKGATKNDDSLYNSILGLHKCVIGIEDDKAHGWWTDIYSDGTKQFFGEKFGLDVTFRKYNPNAFDEYHIKHDLSVMEKLFARYVNERLDMYLKMLQVEVGNMNYCRDEDIM